MEPQIKAAAGDVDAHTLRAGFGLPFREVSYASELGPTPAWFVGGRRGTRVLFVHGHNAPAGRRCACSGWWPARVPGAGAQLPQRSRGPASTDRPRRRWGGDRVARRRGGDQLRPGPRRHRPHPPAPGTAGAGAAHRDRKAVAGVRYALDWRRLDYHRMAPVAD
jgi:hypothetical protein